MDYPHLVRTALTWPSGQLKQDISVLEYNYWMRHAVSGVLDAVYEGHPVRAMDLYSTARARQPWTL